MIKLLIKHNDTYEHSLRVGKLAKIMACHLNFNENQKRTLIAGCLIHDIGKLKIPQEILDKPSALELSEWELIKSHTILGEQMAILKGIKNQDILNIIKHHHEHWDGSGYPNGLKGDEIPVYARICSIVDAFDSMVSDRPYRKGMSVEQAKAEILKNSGKQFDQFYVQQFLNLPDYY